MIFTFVTKNEITGIINPFIKCCIEKPKEIEGYYIIDTFEYAIELGYDANYLNQEIIPTMWWTDNLDDTIKMIFTEKNKSFQIQPSFTERDIKKRIEYFGYENEEVCFFFNKNHNTALLYCKCINLYFSCEVDTKGTITYDNTFRKKLKNCGFVEREYTLPFIIDYLKKIFEKKYFYFLGFVFKTIEIEHPVDVFNTEQYATNITSWFDVWDTLFFVEKYFNEVKIYGLEQSTQLDFDFKKDDLGKYYVQYEYNAAETITGRMFPIHNKGYQALQTLPKEYRHLLKAEKGCVLIEYDYKNFEIKLLECIYNVFCSADISILQPHEKICDLLHIDPIEFRSFGKTINYSIIYGMGISSIINMICEKIPTLDKEVVQYVLEEYNLYNYAQTVMNILHTRSVYERTFIINYFSRGIKVEKEYALLNNYIQSTATDFVYRKIMMILNLFKQSELSEKNKILLQNHDSILVQLESSVVLKDIIPKTIENILNSPIKQLQCYVGVKSGLDWGTLT